MAMFMVMFMVMSMVVICVIGQLLLERVDLGDPPGGLLGFREVETASFGVQKVKHLKGQLNVNTYL